MPDDLVTLRTLDDAAQAEMFRDLLAQEGIVAMIPGAQHRALLGVLGSYIQIQLKVRGEDAERAMQILEAFDGGDESEDAPSDEMGSAAPSRRRKVADRSDRYVPRKLKRTALCLAFVFPGGGHFYLGEWTRGAFYLLAQIGLLAYLRWLSGEPGVALVWVPCLLLADGLGAASRVPQQNGGAPPRGPMIWASRGLPLMPVMAAVGFYLAAERAPDWYVGEEGTTLCTRLQQCAPDAPKDCTLRLSRGLRLRTLGRNTVTDCSSCVAKLPCPKWQAECDVHCQQVYEVVGLPSLLPAPEEDSP